MNKHEREYYVGMLARLERMGIPFTVAERLRRISMTLRRWHELECGDGNEYASWTIARGHKGKDEFIHDDDGAPYMERHSHNDGRVHYYKIPDRERGARRRLDVIMKEYPALVAYVQSDPRGAALYIVERARVPAGVELDCVYSSYGVAVY